MIWLIVSILAIAGFAGLCLSIRKHQVQVFGYPLSKNRSRIYSRIGWGLLVAMTVCCLGFWGWSVGLVASFAAATLGSVIVILSLSLKPDLVRYLCWLPDSQPG